MDSALPPLLCLPKPDIFLMTWERLFSMFSSRGKARIKLLEMIAM